MRSVLAWATMLLAASTVSAQVIMDGTETFDTDGTVNGALWTGCIGEDVHAPDAFSGWQIKYINRDPYSQGKARFYFGNNQQRDYSYDGGATIVHGQPYPGTHSGTNEGALLIQHDCKWGNSTDPGTGQPYNPASNMIAYISFHSTIGHVYELSAWVNSIQNLAAADGTHPVAANAAQAGFPAISLGLKDGLFNPDTDFDGPWTPVTGLTDTTWVQTPAVQMTATSETMTIILQVENPDTKSGVGIMTDTSWDDVRIVDLDTACPSPWADTDADSDVDQVDFAILQTCYTGSDPTPGAYDASRCHCFDRDEDDDIDQADTFAFNLCSSGPGVFLDSPECQ